MNHEDGSGVATGSPSCLFFALRFVGYVVLTIALTNVFEESGFHFGTTGMFFSSFSNACAAVLSVAVLAEGTLALIRRSRSGGSPSP